MKIKKLVALGMTTALCAATVFGCGSGDGDSGEQTQVTLKVWSPQEDQSAGWLQQMCEQFNEEHPEWDITFKYEVCGEDKAGEQITADPTEAADVFMFANDQLGTLLNADAIAKLGGTVAEEIKASNDEKMVATVTKDGDIYGIPYTANTWFMYYDKSVFSEQDVKSLDTMLEKGVVSFQFGTGWYFGSFYAAAGATYCGENGDDESAGIVLGDKATDVTKYLVGLVDNKNFVKDEDGSGMAGLRDGSVSAIFSGTWDYAAAKEALGENLGICQLPTINVAGEDVPLKSFAGSKALGVNPHCENMEVAVALAQYLASEEAQLTHYQMRSIVPCNLKLLASDEVSNDALAQAQANTIANTSVIQPTNSSFNTNFWDNATNMANDILNDVVTLDNAAEKTQALEKAWNGQ